MLNSTHFINIWPTVAAMGVWRIVERTIRLVVDWFVGGWSRCGFLCVAAVRLAEVVARAVASSYFSLAALDYVSSS